jgi:hypothetical protein
MYLRKPLVAQAKFLNSVVVSGSMAPAASLTQVQRSRSLGPTTALKKARGRLRALRDDSSNRGDAVAESLRANGPREASGCD